MDPEERFDIVQSVRLAKSGTNEYKNDRCLQKCGIQTQIIVGLILKFCLTVQFLVICIHNPRLRHVPSFAEREIKHDNDHEEEKSEKEKVEFS